MTTTKQRLPQGLLRELAVEIGCDERLILRGINGGTPKTLIMQQRLRFSLDRRGLGHLVAHLPPSPILLIVSVGTPEQKP